MAVKPNKTKPATITEAPYPNSVRKEANTTLSGNQGSPQPGAPKSHSVSRTGNRAHRIGAFKGAQTQRNKSNRNTQTKANLSK